MLHRSSVLTPSNTAILRSEQGISPSKSLKGSALVLRSVRLYFVYCSAQLSISNTEVFESLENLIRRNALSRSTESFELHHRACCGLM